MTCIDDYVNRIIQGDCLEVLKGMPDNSVDTVIQDPPSGINFMGKKWDSDKGGMWQWVDWLANIQAECLRVLKPGGSNFCWALPRTSHWTGTALELAGFEIRDIITHLFGQGFPKNYSIQKGVESKLVNGSANWNEFRKLNGKDKDGHIGYTKIQANQGYRPDDYTGNGRHFDLEPQTEEAKLWEGYGTALKPAAEFWYWCIKPVEGGFANNALTWGVAGLWIDGGRIETNGIDKERHLKEWDRLQTQSAKEGRNAMNGGLDTIHLGRYAKEGRWPANVILDEEAARLLDEQSGVLKSGDWNGYTKPGESPNGHLSGKKAQPYHYKGDSGGASRFFYCAKSSKRERGDYNNHPTVKPLNLLEYLCKLSRTPTGGIVLDPFAGSGTTALAALKTGRQYICIEQDPHYVEIAERRIAELEGVQLELTDA